MIEKIGTINVVKEEIISVNLRPIQEKIDAVKLQRKLQEKCAEAQISRNHLHLILRGKTKTTEATLTRLLTVLNLSWSDVALI